MLNDSTIYGQFVIEFIQYVIDANPFDRHIGRFRLIEMVAKV